MPLKKKQKPKQKLKKTNPNLKVLSVYCADICEHIEIVLGKDGFHFYNFPSASLKEFLKESAKIEAIWEALPNYERREF